MKMFTFERILKAYLQLYRYLNEVYAFLYLLLVNLKIVLGAGSQSGTI